MSGRSDTMGKYFLTGATGFLGSHIMSGLLMKGKSVVIAGRPADGMSLKERIRKLLVWFGIEHLENRLEFQETDFLKPRMGLEDNEYSRLCSNISCIIHCASDTSFSERNRERVVQSNVGSLNEILKFAHNTRAERFYYISTVYAAGNEIQELHEAPVKAAAFNNVYEESKAKAEKIISDKCGQFSIPFTIIRPSIVYGDSVTGRSLRFNAVYYAVRSILYIRDIYLNDIKNNAGLKSERHHIFKNSTGLLHLPLRIFIPQEGRINLIPADYFTAATLSILDENSPEKFYHITARNSESITRLVSYAEHFLGITGIEVITGVPDANDIRNPAEELFDHFIKPYRPYLSDQRTFNRNNTDKVNSGIRLPEFSYEIFQRCMSYAVSADWGKNFLG